MFLMLLKTWIWKCLTKLLKVTRNVSWDETCEYKYRLDASVCNNQQRWNKDKCRCESKELIDNGRCDERLIWNPSKFECECDKLCDVRQYLEYESCKCRKKLVDKLVEECRQNIDENEMIYNTTLNDYEIVYNSCTVYIVLLATFLIISIGISCAFIYFHWYLTV